MMQNVVQIKTSKSEATLIRFTPLFDPLVTHKIFLFLFQASKQNTWIV